MNDLAIINDGALLIRDGVIQQVGPSRRVENLREARGAIEINASGKVVMPGLVDCHTHLMFPLAQGSNEPDIDLDRAARYITSLTAQRLAGRGRPLLRAMARHGTTTLEAKSGCGPNESAEIKVLRVLRVLAKGPLDIVPTFLFHLGAGADRRADAEAAEVVFRDLMFKIRRRRLADFADLQWDQDAARRPLLVRFLDTAVSLGFHCKIHADQHHCGGAVHLAALYGATSIDHLDHTTLDQARLLASTSTIATLLPASSLRTGHHAPARTLIDSGVAVALGSNFNSLHSPSLNMQTAIALAAIQMSMTPAEAISAATINAARALRVARHVGSLECDKYADLLILDTSDHRDLATHLGTNLVHTTMKRGEILFSLKNAYSGK